MRRRALKRWWLGAIYYAMGDKEAVICAEESATRTLVVVGAAALVAGTGGTVALVVAGVVAGVLMDGVVTGEITLFAFWRATIQRAKC